MTSIAALCLALATTIQPAGETEYGFVFRLYQGVRNGGHGVEVEEIVAEGSLAVVDAEWAADMVSQASQLQKTFGLSRVRIWGIGSLPGWEFEARDARMGDYGYDATAKPAPGGKIRTRVTLRVHDSEIGTTDVLATPERTFTLAGLDPVTGDYVFLTVTPWKGAPPEAPTEGILSTMLDEPPKRLEMVPPAYPPDLRKELVQGNVVLRLLVSRDGTVSEAEVLHADHPGLGKAAQEAALAWRYEPGKLDGNPMGYYLVAQVRFKLE